MTKYRLLPRATGNSLGVWDFINITPPRRRDSFMRRSLVAVTAILVLVVGSTLPARADVDWSAYNRPQTETVIGEPLVVFVIDVPNEPEDATGRLADVLIELGATNKPDNCECLTYVGLDRTIQVVFRFHP